MLTRRYADFAAAEDAVQEALLVAATRWPRDGVPERPRGWLIQTAERRLLDAWRSDMSRRRREEVAARHDVGADVQDADDTLTLLFLCCHPALTPASSIALTLRAVGGLTTAEVARAFLVPEPTMAQRISRAKQRIATSDEPFRMPTEDELPTRLASVLHVLYLVFNEGYAASAGQHLHRADLADEAIRMARLVHAAFPAHAEASGLLALMLLTDARRPARTDASGELVPLADQDRRRWDRAKVAEGTRLVDAVLADPADRPRDAGPVGEYVLQAAIAAVHDQAATAGDTDWRHILALYELLEQLTASPVVRINRAVAAAMVDGPAAGLAMLEEVDKALPSYHRTLTVRAHLLEMAGDQVAAREGYTEAAARATSLPERRYLAGRAAALRNAPPDADGSATPPGQR